MSEQLKRIEQVKIPVALIDPGWGWGTMVIDNQVVASITLLHPTLGHINSIVGQQTLNQLVEGLTELRDSFGHNKVKN